MEFHEKLQQLRKNKGLTQEELAEILYVSRTAVSKWESGRGYPNIDSLKDISSYFLVSLDDLLSSDQLIDLAQKESTLNIRNNCHLLMGLVDLLSVFFLVLPLYPKNIDGFIYSVNLWEYTQLEVYNRMVYWIIFILMIMSAVLKVLGFYLKWSWCKKSSTYFSFGLSIFSILYFVLTKEVYVCLIVIFLLMMKCFLLVHATTGCLELK